jgi:hypothetical protein
VKEKEFSGLSVLALVALPAFSAFLSQPLTGQRDSLCRLCRLFGEQPQQFKAGHGRYSPAHSWQLDTRATITMK